MNEMLHKQKKSVSTAIGCYLLKKLVKFNSVNIQVSSNSRYLLKGVIMQDVE